MNWSGFEAGRGIKTMAGGMESKARGRGTGSPTRGRFRNDRGGQPPGKHAFSSNKSGKTWIILYLD